MAKRILCATCCHEGKAVRKTRGNILIELILWCCFIVPGLIYSIWRQSTKYDACRKCGSSSVLPTDSPMAKKLRHDLDHGRIRTRKP